MFQNGDSLLKLNKKVAGNLTPNKPVVAMPTPSFEGLTAKQKKNLKKKIQKKKKKLE